MLDAQIAALRQADTLHLHDDLASKFSAKLLQLTQLRGQLASGANGVPPAAIRALVASAVADIRAYTSEARNAVLTIEAGAAAQTAQAELAQADEHARQCVTGFMDDYYQRRIFDKYLKFASKKDGEEYRRREAERQRAIDEARAEHTPDGDLRAAKLSLAQLDDAGAHGATRSRDYQKLHDRLSKSVDRLSAALPAQTVESKAAGTDPLDGVKPSADVPPAVITSFRDAGVGMPDQQGSGHGVTAAAPPSPAHQGRK